MEIPDFVYKDVNEFTTAEGVMDEINRILKHLEAVAATLTEEDVRDKDKMKWFMDHTGWIRMLYSRLERITLDTEEDINA